jgi:hypothetical protein
MHRIYFDSNEGTETNSYGLWLDKSKADLAKIPGGPREGTRITIYMVGEIEMQAALEMEHSTERLDCAANQRDYST